MKLYVCDYKKINIFDIPKVSENFFMLNIEFNGEKDIFNETLTLKKLEDAWIINADEKLKIKTNNTDIQFIKLNENTFFEIKFADMTEYFKIFILNDICEFQSYSIYNYDLINVGSSNNCLIECPNLFNEVFKLEKKGLNYWIERTCENKNSVYLNDNVFNHRKLSVGDTIFVDGIRIIYMKDFLLINKFNYNVVVKKLVLIEKKDNGIKTPITPVNDIEKNVKLYTDDKLFTHTPRMKQVIEEKEVSIENPPGSQKSEKMPAFITYGSTFIMSLTSGLYLIQSINSFLKGSTEFFSFIITLISCGTMFIASFFIPLITEKWQKKMEDKREKLRVKKYDEYLQEKELEIDNIVKKQSQIIKENNLSYQEINENIKNHDVSIWERELIDDDFLSISLGIGNIKPKLEVNVPQKGFTLEEDQLENKALDLANKKRFLENVPIVFSCLENKIIPVILNITDFEKNDDYIKSIILQLIYYHSGKDLKIVTITNKYNEYKWEFIKYLPHSWDNNLDNCYFATNSDEYQQLSLLLEQKYDQNKNFDIKKSDEYYLIITDDFKSAREMPFINKIVNSEDKRCFSLLIFEKSIIDLPSRFNSLIEINDNGGKIIYKNDSTLDPLLFKPTFIENIDIDKYTKIISNIPVFSKNYMTSIPSSLNFLEMFKVGRVDQLNILSRWKNNDPTNSLKTVIGIKENDKLVELDLHEKFHGPHGLIAGSTGSGKSEFIITFILSMAINYHPYEVQFILIDYKGGGLTGAFENREKGIKIPHLVGTITNLDKSEMGRTLVSIKSELQRRQRVFNETREALDLSTLDIYKYQRLYREGKVKNPMSHLFIISDEFAELKEQQPDFMDELVSTARIGRSLGVHLILATQKPSGVVDQQIWSNTRFRVCLKVQTPDDSEEMLKNKDAAYIKEAGRFYLQVGNDEIYELGQSGWTGAKYVPTDNVQKKVNDDIIFVNNLGSTLKNVNEVVKKSEQEDLGDQLSNIVKYLYDLAKKENLKFSSLWLDSIPKEIYLDDLMKKYPLEVKKQLINPIVGEYDDPANQRQGVITIPFYNSGNICVRGSSGGGKSTFLSTMIYSIIIYHSAENVNIYIIDLGSEKLKAFKNAPQVGDVLTSEDKDKIYFLFYMLIVEKNKRFEYYSKNGGSFERDLKTGNIIFPQIILIINDFDVFRENFSDFYDDEFTPFVRNCSKVGISVVIALDSVSGSVSLIESYFPKKIALQLNSPSDYSDFFETRLIPKNSPGRGLIEKGGTYEFQTALIDNYDFYDKKIATAIKKLNEYLKLNAKNTPIIPDRVLLDEIYPYITDLSNVPLGIDVKTAQIDYYDFSNTLSVMSGGNKCLTALKRFLNFLIDIFLHINNSKIIVLNAYAEKIKVSERENLKIYENGFSDIVKIINKNVEKIKENPKKDQFIVIIIGYSKIKDLIDNSESDENSIKLDELILNASSLENFKFVIYERESSISSITDGDIDYLFKGDTGIWIGGDFDMQSVFETQRYDSSVRLNNSNITIINKGNVNNVKFN